MSRAESASSELAPVPVVTDVGAEMVAVLVLVVVVVVVVVAVAGEEDG